MSDVTDAVERADWIRAWEREASPKQAAFHFRYALVSLEPALRTMERVPNRYNEESLANMRDAITEIRAALERALARIEEG